MEEQGLRRVTESSDEVNLLDYCRLIWGHRKLLASLCVTSILVSLVYSLVTPKVYKSSASIIPPKETGLGTGGQLAISLGSGGARAGEGLGLIMDSTGGISLSAPTPTRDAYLAILKSRTMREEIQEHFRKTWGPSVASLIGKVSVSSSKEGGTMVVSVESLDPKLAAEVANFYFNNLSSFLARRAKETAKVQLAYYEQQLERTSKELKQAQGELIEFQEKHRYIGLDPATKSAIAAGAAQAGSTMALEMERNIRRMYLTESHPEMIALDRRIYEAKKLLSHQLYGEPQPLPPESPGSPPRKEFFVAAAKMTPLQFRLIDVYRNLKFREVIAAYIAQNIEALKYTGENPAAMQIDWLDRAIPPGGPFKPNISFNLMAAAIGSLIIGIFLVFFLEYIERLKALERLRHAEASGSMVGTPSQ